MQIQHHGKIKKHPGFTSIPKVYDTIFDKKMQFMFFAFIAANNQQPKAFNINPIKRATKKKQKNEILQENAIKSIKQ